MHFPHRSRADTAGRQPRKAFRTVLSAAIGLLLASGLLAAASVSPALAPAPSAAVLPGASGRVYVTNQLDDTVSVIDAGTNKVLATVPAGRAPEGVAVAPDNKHAYIADNGSAK